MPQLAQQAGFVLGDRVIFAAFFSRLISFFRILACIFRGLVCGFGVFFG